MKLLKQIQFLELGDKVNLLLLGGAKRTLGDDIEYGSGGDLSIISNGFNSQLIQGSDNYYLGFGGLSGGAFEITRESILIDNISTAEWLAGQTANSSNLFSLPSFFFSDSGFSNFNINTANSNLEIKSGADIKLRTSSLFIPI